MDKVATCKCGCQSWSITDYKIICSKCREEYHFYSDMPADKLINLVNDNY